MSLARRGLHGLLHYEEQRAFAGYTLFAPMYGKNVWLIDMWGTILHRWQVENLRAVEARAAADAAALESRMAIPPKG